MVDVARYFLEFNAGESCGKCSPCREGSAQSLSILSRITKGEGVPADLALLQLLGRVMKDSSLCALGQTSPNPITTTLNYFRHEYEEHIREKRCHAGTCESLFMAGSATSIARCAAGVRCWISLFLRERSIVIWLTLSISWGMRARFTRSWSRKTATLRETNRHRRCRSRRTDGCLLPGSSGARGDALRRIPRGRRSAPLWHPPVPAAKGVVAEGDQGGGDAGCAVQDEPATGG